MSISKKEFLKDVEHEIKMLRQHATKNELENLLDYIDGQSVSSCIYGQLTGSCESLRAKELMNKSCIRVVHDNKDGFKLSLISGLWQKRENETFRDIKKFINDEYNSQMWKLLEGERNYEYYSALEVYILLKGSKHKNILNYLKYKTNELSL